MERDFGNYLNALGGDPLLWRECAVELKLAADALLPHYYEAMRDRSHRRDAMQRKFAYFHGYFILVGLAVENALKGLRIAEDPSLVTTGGVNNRILQRGGHGIKTGLDRFLSLDSEEANVAMRLEESLVWAAKYPVPLAPSTLAKAEQNVLRSHISTDPETIDGIFTRLLALYPSSDSPYAEPSPN